MSRLPEKLAPYMHNTDISSSQIDGGILAGGLGRRFGGQDKGLIRWQQDTLIQPITQCLRPHIDRLYISCNRNIDIYADYCDATVTDESSEYLGPLAGLLALLEASQAQYMIISPCDTPLLPADFVPRMKAELEKQLKQSGSQAFPVLAVENGERQHPLHLLIPAALKHSIRETLAAGDRKMMRWLLQQQPHWVDFSDQPLGFANVNDESAMAELKARLAQLKS